MRQGEMPWKNVTKNKHIHKHTKNGVCEAFRTDLPRLLTQGTAPAADQSLQELDRLAREAPNLDKSELLERLQALVDQVAS